MTERDPSPSEILSDMLAEAADDAVGVWRVSVPTTRQPSFAEAVEMARQGLAQVQASEGGAREAQALSRLVTACLVRHEVDGCTCVDRTNRDPICAYAQELATAIAGF